MWPPTSEEVRHASRNADSVCSFLYWRDGKKGHAESAFRNACRTSSAPTSYIAGGGGCGRDYFAPKMDSLLQRTVLHVELPPCKLYKSNIRKSKHGDVHQFGCTLPRPHPQPHPPYLWNEDEPQQRGIP